jgi:hypothetical protein
MAHLAYDRVRLQMAHRELNLLSSELAVISSIDPDAAGAIAAVGAAKIDLDTWKLMIQRVLFQDPLGADVLSTLNPFDWLIVGAARQAGWSVAIDPSLAGITMTDLDARALGTRLSDDELDWHLLSDAEIADIEHQLAQVALDPALTAAFLGTFHSWNSTLDDAARRHQATTDLVGVEPFESENRALLRDLDSIFVSFGAIRQSVPRTGRTGYPSWVMSLDSYAAAMLVVHLGLDDTTFGRISADIFAEWVRDDPDSFAEIPFGSPHLPGDALWEHLQKRPRAAAVFLLRGGFTLQELMMGTNDEWRDLERLLVRGTAPEVMTLEQAAGVVPALLVEVTEMADRFDWMAYIRSDGEPHWSTRVIAAAVSSPWLIQLSPQNTDWAASLDTHTKREILEHLVHDADAAEALGARTDDLFAGRLPHIADRPNDEVMGDVAALIGLLAQVVANDRVESEEHRLAQYDMMFDLVGIGVGLVPLPVVASVTADVAVVVTQQIAAGHGWFDYPDPQRVADEQNYLVEWTVASGASLLLTLCTPDGAPPPPQPDPDATDPLSDFQTRVDAWAEEAFDDPDERDEVTEAMDRFLADAFGGTLAGS